MSTKKPALVCVVLPAFNEAKVIKSVINNAIESFKEQNLNTKFIVVDDGSSDQTAKQIPKHKDVIIIRHILNSGVGAATLTGFEYAKTMKPNIIVTMDADGQHLADDAICGINFIMNNGQDLVIGSRLKSPGNMSNIKIIGNRLLSLLTAMLFHIKISDSQSGLRIFGQNAIAKLTWNSDSYEFCSEMLWRARQLRLDVGEFKIKSIYTEYSKQKGQSNWNAFNIIKSLVKQRISGVFK